MTGAVSFGPAPHPAIRMTPDSIELAVVGGTGLYALAGLQDVEAHQPVTRYGTPSGPVRVGDRVRLWRAHVDPTVAYHERMWLVRGDEVVDHWEVDLLN